MKFLKSKKGILLTLTAAILMSVLVFVLRLPSRDRTKEGITNAVILATQFVPFTGEHIALKRRVMDRLKDPESYQHIDTRVWPDDTGVMVSMRFRSKNSFGGYTPDEFIAQCDSQGYILNFYMVERGNLFESNN
jgi:hypothetical protein